MTSPKPQSLPCGCSQGDTISRRATLLGILGLFALSPRTFAKTELPREVAGITLPTTPAAIAAAQYAKEQCPDFLFNHCIRTFLFGAVAMTHHKMEYNAEDAFIASSLHDLGLLQKLASADRSFEMDGANLASQFALSNGTKPQDSEEVWWAVALHDTRFAFSQHRSGTAMLVSMGAGSDVMGPDEDMLDAKQTAEIVAAFPRLAFKKRFTQLLVEHCRRKPLSQRSTWLEGLCREQKPGVWNQSLEQQIASAPFSE